MVGRIHAHLRNQWIGALALFLALAGGAAYAAFDPVGNDADIDACFEKRSGDLDLKKGRKCGKSEKPVTWSQVGPAGEPGPQGVKGDQGEQGIQGLRGTARAYAHVNPGTCTATPGTCRFDNDTGISSVTRDDPGSYCVTAPGINAIGTPAAVTLDFSNTMNPEGNATAMTSEGSGCGPSDQGFAVVTERQPSITVNAGAGTNNATAVGPAVAANDVAFTIVIP